MLGSLLRQFHPTAIRQRSANVIGGKEKLKDQWQYLNLVSVRNDKHSAVTAVYHQARFEMKENLETCSS